jgi:hypothetical protein
MPSVLLANLSVVSKSAIYSTILSEIYLCVYQNAAPAKPWGTIPTTKSMRIVAEHLNSCARMGASIKGN